MKKFLSAAILVLFALSLFPIAAFADGGDECTSDFDVTDCEPPEGADPDQVLDITQDVLHSLDSGVSSWWAYSNYHQSIDGWDTDEDEIFVVAQYDGVFTSNPGPSPGGTDTVGAGVEGTFKFGYLASINVDWLEEPNWPTEGYVGTFDWNATWTDTNGDGIFNYGEEDLPGYVNWLEQYFEEYGFTYIWWGGEYVPTCSSNGYWINSADGNEGDITGEPDFSCLPVPSRPSPKPLIMMYVYYSPTGFFGGEGPGATNTLTLFSARGEPTVPLREYWAGGSLPEDYELECSAILWDDGGAGKFACDTFLEEVGERRADLRDDPEGRDLLPKIESYYGQLDELGLDH